MKLLGRSEPKTDENRLLDEPLEAERELADAVQRRAAAARHGLPTESADAALRDAEGRIATISRQLRAQGDAERNRVHALERRAQQERAAHEVALLRDLVR